MLSEAELIPNLMGSKCYFLFLNVQVFTSLCESAMCYCYHATRTVIWLDVTLMNYQSLLFFTLPNNVACKEKVQTGYPSITILCEEDTHVIWRAMFSIKRFGDKHLSKHRVDTEYFIWWLICSHPSDAVPDWDVLVLVGTNLHPNKEKGMLSQSQLHTTFY